MLKVVILAAGQGKRMNSSTPKTLHFLAEYPIMGHIIIAIEKLRELGIDSQITVVASEDMVTHPEFLKLEKNHQFQVVIQRERKGTAHALQQALEAESTNQAEDVVFSDVLVLCGDSPLLTTGAIENLIKAHQKYNADATCLGFRASNPHGYGRVILIPGAQQEESSEISKIVEEKDLVDHKIDGKYEICNSGIMILKNDNLIKNIAKITPNAKTGELYLTDLYDILCKNSKSAYLSMAEEEEVLGINTMAQLAIAESVMQRRIYARLQDSGVRVLQPHTSYFAYDVKVAAGCTIFPNVYIGAGVDIAKCTVIHSFSWIEGARIGEGNMIGPYARIRRGTKTSKGVKIGNFVETKNANIGADSKASHLSYLGDVRIGDAVNIGAGTIFCNYDGANKHQSEVGGGVFIGSNSCIVSPVKIEDDVMIAAGSVITNDCVSGDLAIARAKQVNKAGMGRKFLNKSKQKN